MRAKPNHDGYGYGTPMRHRPIEPGTDLVLRRFTMSRKPEGHGDIVDAIVFSGTPDNLAILEREFGVSKTTNGPEGQLYLCLGEGDIAIKGSWIVRNQFGLADWCPEIFRQYFEPC